MENEGGQKEKWMIMKPDDKIIIWTNVIFLKNLFFIIIFGETPWGLAMLI